MIRKIIFLLLLVITNNVFANSMPDFAAIKPAAKRVKVFVNYLAPQAEKLNQGIAKQHKKLIKLYQQWQAHQSITSAEQAWIIQLAQQYEASQFHISNPAAWQRLIKKVDIIPVSLLLAQAANESAWGTSRFAQQGNNFFGQWCYSQGCGIVPLKRPKHAQYEVQKFDDIDDSIASYMHNLNTNPHYNQLRDIRYKLRQENKDLNGADLANGLQRYSQKGKVYVRLIKSLITHYNLAKYDQENSKT